MYNLNIPLSRNCKAFISNPLHHSILFLRNDATLAVVGSQRTQHVETFSSFYSRQPERPEERVLSPLLLRIRKLCGGKARFVTVVNKKLCRRSCRLGVNVVTCR